MKRLIEFKQKGGNWLAAVRTWIQSNCINGSSVIWGTNEVLRPYLTVVQLEEFAACIAVAAIDELKLKGVKFFCNKCCKEMWQSMDKNMKDTTTIAEAEKQAICSDCMLDAIKENRG